MAHIEGRYESNLLKGMKDSLPNIPFWLAIIAGGLQGGVASGRVFLFLRPIVGSLAILITGQDGRACFPSLSKTFITQNQKPDGLVSVLSIIVDLIF